MFLKNDVLRESSGPWYEAKRGLMIYDTSTMPLYIHSNYFYDFSATSDNAKVGLEGLCDHKNLFLVDITEYWYRTGE